MKIYLKPNLINLRKQILIVLIIILAAASSVLFFLFLKKEWKVEINGNDNSEAVLLSNSRVVFSDNIKEKGSLPIEEIFKNTLFPIVAFRPIKKNEHYDLFLPNAHSSLVLDVDSKTILHYQNGREKRQIASLSKLLTALIVAENVKNLEKEVIVEDEIFGIEGTRVGCPRTGFCNGVRLQVGEKISILNLLKAMLMNSANDAAAVLAKEVGGTQEKFVQMMNDKVKKLGLTDSHFCTPSGLEIDGQEASCYSTAYDIARIAARGLDYEIIWKILRTPGPITIYSADNKYSHQVFNTDLAIDQVPNLLGGKTGFTPLAGYSLLLAAADDSGSHKIVAVVLNDVYRWQDSAKMIKWAFENHVWR